MSESSVNIKISASFDKEQILKEFKELTAELEASQLNLSAAIGAKDFDGGGDTGSDHESHGQAQANVSSFDKLFSSLESIARDIKGAVKSAVSPVNAVKEMASPEGLGKEAIGVLGQLLGDLKNTFASEIKGTVDFIKTNILDVAKNLLSLFKTEIDPWDSTVGDAASNIQNSVKEHIGLIVNAVREWLAEQTEQGRKKKQTTSKGGGEECCDNKSVVNAVQSLQSDLSLDLENIAEILAEQLTEITDDLFPKLIKANEFSLSRTILESATRDLASSLFIPISAGLTEVAKGFISGNRQRSLQGESSSALAKIENVDLQKEISYGLDPASNASSRFSSGSKSVDPKLILEAINLLKSIKNLLIEIRNFLLGGTFREKVIASSKQFNNITSAAKTARQLMPGSGGEVNFKVIETILDLILVEVRELRDVTRVGFAEMAGGWTSEVNSGTVIDVEIVDASDPQRVLNLSKATLPANNESIQQSLGDLVSLNREQIQQQRSNLGLISNQSALDIGKQSGGQNTKDAFVQLKGSLANLGKSIASDLGRTLKNFNSSSAGNKATTATTLLSNLINLFNQFINFIRKFNPALATTIDNFVKKLVNQLNAFVSNLIPKLLPLLTGFKNISSSLAGKGQPGTGLNLTSMLGSLKTALTNSGGASSSFLGGLTGTFNKIAQDLKTRLQQPQSSGPQPNTSATANNPDPGANPSTDPGTLLRASAGLLSGGMPTSLPNLPSVDLDKLLPLIKTLTVNLAKNGLQPKQTAKGVVGDLFKLGFDKLIGNRLASLNPMAKLFPKQEASLPAQLLKTFRQTGSVRETVQQVGVDVLEKKFDDLVAIMRSPDDLQTKLIKSIESIVGVDGPAPTDGINAVKSFMGNFLKTGSLGKASQLTAIDVFDNKFKQMIGAFQNPNGDRSDKAAPMFDLATSAVSNAINSGFNPAQTISGTVLDLIGTQLAQNVGNATGNQPQRTTGKGITGGQVARNVASNAVKGGLNPIETARRTGIDLTVKAFQLYLAKLAREAIDYYRNIPVNPMTAPDYLTASIESLANKPDTNLTDWDEANKWNVNTDGVDILEFETLNDAFDKLAELILKVSRIDVTQLKANNKLPSVNIDKYNFLKGSSAYSPLGNKVTIPQSTADSMTGNQIGREQFMQLAHELRHAMQMGFGEGTPDNFNFMGLNDLSDKSLKAPVLDQVNRSVDADIAMGTPYSQQQLTTLELDAEVFARNLADLVYKPAATQQSADPGTLFREIEPALDAIFKQLKSIAANANNLKLAAQKTILNGQTASSAAATNKLVVPDIPGETKLIVPDLPTQVIPTPLVTPDIPTSFMQEPSPWETNNEESKGKANKQNPGFKPPSFQRPEWIPSFAPLQKILAKIDSSIDSIIALLKLSISRSTEQLQAYQALFRKATKVGEKQGSGLDLEQRGEALGNKLTGLIERGLGVANEKIKQRTGMNDDEVKDLADNIGGFTFSALAAFMPTTMLGLVATPIAAALSTLGLPLAALVTQLSPLVSNMMETLQIMVPLQTRVNTVAGSPEGGTEMINYARGVSADLSTPLVASIDGFSRLAAAAKNTRLEGEPLRDLFEGVSYAMSALGLTTQDASGIFLAFQQIISKGKLQAEEIRGQIGERLPGTMNLLANALDMTSSELNKALDLGELYSSAVLPKLAKALKEQFGDAAKNASTSFISAITKIENSLFELRLVFVDAFGGIVTVVANAVANVTKLFSGLVKNIFIDTGILLNAFLGIQATIFAASQVILGKAGAKIPQFLVNLLGPLLEKAFRFALPFLIGTVAELFGTLLGKMLGFEVQDAGKLLQQGFEQMIGGSLQTIFDAFREPGVAIAGLIRLVGGLAKALVTLGGTAYNSIGWLINGLRGESLISGLLNAVDAFGKGLDNILSKSNAVSNVLKGMVKNLAALAPNGLGAISSPDLSLPSLNYKETNKGIDKFVDRQTQGLEGYREPIAKDESLFVRDLKEAKKLLTSIAGPLAKVSLELFGLFLIGAQAGLLFSLIIKSLGEIWLNLGKIQTGLIGVVAQARTAFSAMNILTLGMKGFAMSMAIVFISAMYLFAKSDFLNPVYSSLFNLNKELNKTAKNLQDLSKIKVTPDISFGRNFFDNERDYNYENKGFNLTPWKSIKDGGFTTDDLIRSTMRQRKENSFWGDRPFIPNTINDTTPEELRSDVNLKGLRDQLFFDLQGTSLEFDDARLIRSMDDISKVFIRLTREQVKLQSRLERIGIQEQAQFVPRFFTPEEQAQEKRFTDSKNALAADKSITEGELSRINQAIATVESYNANPTGVRNLFAEDDSILKTFLDSFLNKLPAPVTLPPGQNAYEQFAQFSNQMRTRASELDTEMESLSITIEKLSKYSGTSTGRLNQLNNQLATLGAEKDSLAKLNEQLTLVNSLVTGAISQKVIDPGIVRANLGKLGEQLQSDTVSIREFRQEPNLENLIDVNFSLDKQKESLQKSLDNVVEQINQLNKIIWLPKEAVVKARNEQKKNLKAQEKELLKQLKFIEDDKLRLSNELMSIGESANSLRQALSNLEREAYREGKQGALRSALRGVGEVPSTSLGLGFTQKDMAQQIPDVKSVDDLNYVVNRDKATISNLIAGQSTLNPIVRNNALATLQTGSNQDISSLLQDVKLERDGRILFNGQEIEGTTAELARFREALTGLSRSLNFIDQLARNLRLPGTENLLIDKRPEAIASKQSDFVEGATKLFLNGAVTSDEYLQLTSPGQKLVDIEKVLGDVAKEGLNRQVRAGAMPEDIKESANLIDTLIELKDELKGLDFAPFNPITIGESKQLQQISQVAEINTKKANLVDMLNVDAYRRGGAQQWEQDLQTDNPAIASEIQNLQALEEKRRGLSRQRMGVEEQLNRPDLTGKERADLKIEADKLERENQKLLSESRNSAPILISLRDNLRSIVAQETKVLEDIDKKDISDEQKEKEKRQLTQENRYGFEDAVEMLESYESLIVTNTEEMAQAAAKSLSRIQVNIEESFDLIERRSKLDFARLAQSFTELTSNLAKVQIGGFTTGNVANASSVIAAKEEINQADVTEKETKDKRDQAVKSLELARVEYEKIKSTNPTKDDQKANEEKLKVAESAYAESEVAYSDAQVRKDVAKIALVKAEVDARGDINNLLRAQGSILLKNQLLQRTITVENADIRQARLDLAGIQQELDGIKAKRAGIKELISKGEVKNIQEANKELEELARTEQQLINNELDKKLEILNKERDREIGLLNKAINLLNKYGDALSSGLEIGKAKLDAFTKQLDLAQQAIQAMQGAVTAEINLDIKGREGTENLLASAVELKRTIDSEEATPEEQKTARKRLTDLSRLSQIDNLPGQINPGMSESRFLEEQQKIATAIAREKMDLLKQEQAIAAKLLQIEIERNRVAAEMAVREAEIAMLKAQQAGLVAQQQLQIAVLEGDPTGIKIAELETIIAAQQKNLAILGLNSAKEAAEMSGIIGALQQESAKANDTGNRQGLIDELVGNPNVNIGGLINTGDLSKLINFDPNKANINDVLRPLTDKIDDARGPRLDPNYPLPEGLTSSGLSVQEQIDLALQDRGRREQERREKTPGLNAFENSILDFFDGKDNIEPSGYKENTSILDATKPPQLNELLKIIDAEKESNPLLNIPAIEALPEAIKEARDDAKSMVTFLKDGLEITTEINNWMGLLYGGIQEIVNQLGGLSPTKGVPTDKNKLPSQQKENEKYSFDSSVKLSPFNSIKDSLTDLKYNPVENPPEQSVSAPQKPTFNPFLRDDLPSIASPSKIKSGFEEYLNYNRAPFDALGDPRLKRTRDNGIVSPGGSISYLALPDSTLKPSSNLGGANLSSRSPAFNLSALPFNESSTINNYSHESKLPIYAMDRLNNQIPSQQIANYPVGAQMAQEKQPSSSVQSVNFTIQNKIQAGDPRAGIKQASREMVASIVDSLKSIS